jgi:16S rRNA A1518/A1519 N6-dimethyltransferase RsmA/KsgA/DIM1 with predicted DNA glycosylase/AP lyase activity
MADFQVDRKEIESILSELGLSKSARAEELSCDNWLKMLSFLKHSLK